MDPTEATWQHGLLLIVSLAAIVITVGGAWVFASDAIRRIARKARAAINRLRS